MKVFDSGMPEETFWVSHFDIPGVMAWLAQERIAGPIVEVGTGYGTFSFPLARATGERILSYDIDSELIERACERSEHLGIPHIGFVRADILETGTGLPDGSVGMVLFFNILHSEERRAFLEEAVRILRPGGLIAIIHWRKDMKTPRGPVMESRPDREIILRTAAGLPLKLSGEETILPPYHWGVKFVKGGLS